MNLAVFVGYVMSTASVAVPVVLIPTIASDIAGPGGKDAFAANVASLATCGTAAGKVLMGFACDAFGARRTMMLCFLLMGGSLLLLSAATDLATVGAAQALLEFFNSVMWPCMAIVLATHYGHDQARLDGGIFVLGMSSRFGALLSMPTWGALVSFLGWRAVALVGSAVAGAGFLLVALFVSDTPTKRDEPQGAKLSLAGVSQSLKNLAASRLFLLVACAQAGNAMVRTSERVLGTFFSETGDVSDATGGSLTTFLSGGLLFGVLVFGNAFVKASNARKKSLVLVLYSLSFLSLAGLAVISLPAVYTRTGGATIFVEVGLSFFMAAFVGIQYYQIPPTISSTFGADKGLCASYIDGVGYVFSSVAWAGLAKVVDLGEYVRE
ncbi:hypothetical protein TeGR_g6825 [Tetraparma gracilis]|uniref:Major facilitator superfamily (MFS) profile domain-containing protein n=1 Tax=Tetraparma gracilis TaxID=2962635 RepID=A0ABQ6MNE2_9STRA|nr:hypothetical protein TeGR_g6825 [Tetraparma gracilis]